METGEELKESTGDKVLANTCSIAADSDSMDLPENNSNTSSGGGNASAELIIDNNETSMIKHEQTPFTSSDFGTKEDRNRRVAPSSEPILVGEEVEEKTDKDKIDVAVALIRTENVQEKGDTNVGEKAAKDDKDNDGADGKSKKSNALGLYTKVVFRNLPLNLSAEEFLEIVNPDVNEFDYFSFTYADKFYGDEAAGTAHLSFVDPDNAESYMQRFDGYIIIDQTGYEWIMSTDYAICQNVPQPSTKPDPLMGTIEDSEDYKKFCELYDKTPDGVLGVPPTFADAKEMSDQTLKLIEEKEEMKGKLQSTPLLDSLRERLKTERAKLTKEREELIEHRKEGERLRALRKDKRRERREQDRQEKRERRDKERRESRRLRQEKALAEKSTGGRKETNKTEATKKLQEMTKKEEPHGVKSDEKEKTQTKSDTKDLPTLPSSSAKLQTSNENKSRQDNSRYKDRGRSDRDRDRDRSERDREPNSRHSYNDRRTYNERRSGADKEKDKQPRRFDDRAPNTSKKNSASVQKSKETSENVKSESTAVADQHLLSDKTAKQSTQSTQSSSVETKHEDAKISKDDATSKDTKKKIVKKVVKIIKVKSTDTVPVDGKVIEKQNVRKQGDNMTSKKDSNQTANSAAVNDKSESVTASKQETSSKPTDRPKKGRPDMQIYRPGSWRQNTSTPATATATFSANSKNVASSTSTGKNGRGNTKSSPSPLVKTVETTSEKKTMDRVDESPKD